MSFRGFDFQPGFNKYTDLMRAAYQDKAKQVDDIYDRGLKYGTDIPEQLYADNPYYRGASLGPQNNPNLEQNPNSLSVPEALPEGNWQPFVPKEPQSSVMPEDGRSPAAQFTYKNAAEAEQYNREMMDRNLQWQKRSDEVRNSLLDKALAAGEQIPVVDQLKMRVADRPRIHPYLLRQIMELEQKGETTSLADVLKKLGGQNNSGSTVNIQSPQGVSRAPNPNRKKELQDYMKNIKEALPDRTKSNPRSFDRWLKAGSSEANDYTKAKNELSGLMFGGNTESGSSAKKTIKKIKIGNEFLTKEEALKKHPGKKPQIEAAFK